MKSHKMLFFLLLLIGCLTQFASDIYAPSLPAIAESLHAPIHLAQMSMAIYMFGVACTQLIYGPLSEGIGRRIPLSIGLAIMLLGSIICLTAPNIQLLILGRFIQGCGAGACASLWRSIFRDVFTGEELAKYGSFFTMFVMFIVPAAPLLGGYLQNSWGWRGSFVFMLLFVGVALLTAMYGFHETSNNHHRSRLNFSYIIKTYFNLVKNPTFIGASACTFLIYGAFFSWFVVGPVLLIHTVGISPSEFGWLSFIGGGSTYALGGWINGKFVRNLGIPFMLKFGFSIMIFAGLLMLLFKLIIGLNLIIVIIPVIIFYFGTTFIWPNTFAMAFMPFGEIAGYAGSLYGFMLVSGGAIIGALMSHLPSTNQISLASVYIIAPTLAWLLFEKNIISR